MRFLILIVIAVSIAGCYSAAELKAPCDYQAHFCGPKVKINQGV